MNIRVRKQVTPSIQLPLKPSRVEKHPHTVEDQPLESRMHSERCTSGSERGYRKPTAERPYGTCNLLIPYIPTDEGWLYCAAHKDLFTGRRGFGQINGPALCIELPPSFPVPAHPRNCLDRFCCGDIKADRYGLRH